MRTRIGGTRLSWNRNSKYPKVYISLYGSIVILLIIVFITGSAMIFSLCIVIGLFIFLNNKYLDYLYRKVSIPNEVQTIRLYPEEEGETWIPIENRGELPVFSGELSFDLHDTEEAIEVIGMENNRNSFYYSHVTLLPRKRKRHKVQLKALKRGIVQIRSIEFTIHDLLHFGSSRLEYLGGYRGEIIVFPKIKPVLGLERMLQFKKGEHQQKDSLHDDIMLAVGTRDYHSHDPFNRIHWKASARSQQLQTKVYEKTTLFNWTLIIHMTDDRKLPIDDIEQVLSHVAYCCQFAAVNNIQFEIFINIKTPGSFCLHLPSGSGRVHLIKAMEFLARIRKNGSTINGMYMLRAIKKQSDAPIILHFGSYSSEAYQFYRSWTYKKNVVVYRLKTKEGSGQLLKIGEVKDEVIAN